MAGDSSISGTSLLTAVARGDASAFETLYDRYAPVVYALLLRMLGRPEDAQEILQETFAQSWSRASAYDPSRGSDAAWLMSIARSRAIDRLRSRQVRATREMEAAEEISRSPAAVEKRTGEESAILSEERRLVRSELAELPAPQRTALELAYFDGLTQSEIAARLNEPLGTIKTRIQLGMKKLKERLAGTLR